MGVNFAEFLKSVVERAIKFLDQLRANPKKIRFKLETRLSASIK